MPHVAVAQLRSRAAGLVPAPPIGGPRLRQHDLKGTSVAKAECQGSREAQADVQQGVAPTSRALVVPNRRSPRRVLTGSLTPPRSTPLRCAEQRGCQTERIATMLQSGAEVLAAPLDGCGGGLERPFGAPVLAMGCLGCAPSIPTLASTSAPLAAPLAHRAPNPAPATPPASSANEEEEEERAQHTRWWSQQQHTQSPSLVASPLDLLQQTSAV